MTLVKVNQDTYHRLTPIVENHVVEMDASIAEELVYKGQTEFIPTEETQIINVEGMKVVTNIIIKPIPKDYGQIEYSGSSLTIL